MRSKTVDTKSCSTCIHALLGVYEEPCVDCERLDKYEDARDCGVPIGVLDTQVGGSHYQLPIQPIDFIVKNDISYREGNAIKYITRHKDKNGAEDIKKAIHYLQMILEEYGNE